MPDERPILSFRLPEAESVEAFVVSLPDGRRLVRTREELLELERLGVTVDVLSPAETPTPDEAA